MEGVVKYDTFLFCTVSDPKMRIEINVENNLLHLSIHLSSPTFDSQIKLKTRKILYLLVI